MCDVWCMTCDVWCVMCDVRCVIVWFVMCDVWCVMCDVWCVMCDVWFVMCDLWCVIFDVWCVMCDVWCAMCNVWCAICDLWCVIFDVWCVMYDMSYGIYDLWRLPFCFNLPNLRSHVTSKQSLLPPVPAPKGLQSQKESSNRSKGLRCSISGSSELKLMLYNVPYSTSFITFCVRQFQQVNSHSHVTSRHVLPQIMSEIKRLFTNFTEIPGFSCGSLFFWPSSCIRIQQNYFLSHSFHDTQKNPILEGKVSSLRFWIVVWVGEFDFVFLMLWDINTKYHHMLCNMISVWYCQNSYWCFDLLYLLKIFFFCSTDTLSNEFFVQ